MIPPASRAGAEALLLQKLGLHNARGELAEKIAAALPLSAALPPEALPLERVRFWVVDVETSGQGPPRDRIIEVAGVEVVGLAAGRSFTTLVNPGLDLPEFIVRLTGITPVLLETAPKPEAVVPLLDRLFAGSVLCAHHAAFDLKFLDHEFREVLGKALDLPAVCTVRLARRVHPELPSHNLDALARRYRLRFGPAGLNRGRHRALGDAQVTAAIFLALLRKLRRAGVNTLADLRRFQNLPLRQAHALLAPFTTAAGR